MLNVKCWVPVFTEVCASAKATATRGRKMKLDLGFIR